MPGILARDAVAGAAYLTPRGIAVTFIGPDKKVPGAFLVLTAALREVSVPGDHPLLVAEAPKAVGRVDAIMGKGRDVILPAIPDLTDDELLDLGERDTRSFVTFEINQEIGRRSAPAIVPPVQAPLPTPAEPARQPLPWDEPPAPVPTASSGAAVPSVDSSDADAGGDSGGSDTPTIVPGVDVSSGERLHAASAEDAAATPSEAEVPTPAVSVAAPVKRPRRKKDGAPLPAPGSAEDVDAIGRAARRGGKARGVPSHLESQADAWRAGWDAADAELAGATGAAPTPTASEGADPEIASPSDRNADRSAGGDTTADAPTVLGALREIVVDETGRVRREGPAIPLPPSFSAQEPAEPLPADPADGDSAGTGSTPNIAPRVTRTEEVIGWLEEAHAHAVRGGPTQADRVRSLCEQVCKAVPGLRQFLVMPMDEVPGGPEIDAAIGYLQGLSMENYEPDDGTDDGERVPEAGGRSSAFMAGRAAFASGASLAVALDDMPSTWTARERGNFASGYEDARGLAADPFFARTAGAAPRPSGAEASRAVSAFVEGAFSSGLAVVLDTPVRGREQPLSGAEGERLGRLGWDFPTRQAMAPSHARHLLATGQRPGDRYDASGNPIPSIPATPRPEAPATPAAAAPSDVPIPAPLREWYHRNGWNEVDGEMAHVARLTGSVREVAAALVGCYDRPTIAAALAFERANGNRASVVSKLETRLGRIDAGTSKPRHNEMPAAIPGTPNSALRAAHAEAVRRGVLPPLTPAQAPTTTADPDAPEGEADAATEIAADLATVARAWPILRALERATARLRGHGLTVGITLHLDDTPAKS